ncbi:hypothetical protein ACOMHN_048043 [Nucella lapillus]
MERGVAKSAGGKKSGGLPSSRASDAAERSPSVYFANLKADMLLQKQRQVIKRAENSLVHRIIIDQKILFRQFQAKLRRSKLARARLWGDKDAERQLRARDLHVMNTNCGQDQYDLEFLKKLQKRPCLVDVDDLQLEEAKILSRPSSKTAPVTDKDMEDLIRTVLDEQDPPPTEKTLQSLSTIGRLLEEARLVSPSVGSDNARQAGTHSRQMQRITIQSDTVPALRKNPEEETVQNKTLNRRKLQTTGREGSSLSQERVTNKNQPRPKTSVPKYDLRPSGEDKTRPRPFTSPVRSLSRTRPNKASLKTPHPASAVSRTKSAQSSLTLGTSSPGHVSRRPSQAASSMFEEQKKIDMVALRLADARSTDYTPRVSAFIQTLLDLDKKERRRSLRPEDAGEASYGPKEASGGDLQPDSDREEEKEEGKKEELKGDRKFDYYATKMALYAASVKKAPPVSLPGTPEEINMKLVGDQTIKSITMPPLRLYHHPEQGEAGAGGEEDERDVYQDYGYANVLTLHQEE